MLTLHKKLNAVRVALLSVVMVGVVACQPVQQHWSINQDDKSFTGILARHYKQFSSELSHQQRWEQSQYFLRKARRAAQGVHPDPEHVQDWDVRSLLASDLVEARRVLLDKVNSHVMAKDPEAAASAHFLYDCWVVQESMFWLKQDTSCRTAFFEVINHISLHYLEKEEEQAPPASTEVASHAEPEETVPALEDAAQAEEVAAEEQGTETAEVTEEPVDEATKEAEATDTLTQTKVLYFPFDSAIVSPESMQLLLRLMEVKDISGYSITLNGHTDRAGSESYNLVLSQRRAEEVKKILVASGLKSEQIEAFGFGESDPAVETADGVRNPHNRRVEMYTERQEEAN